MLEGEKILFTGASGKIAFPIARELAGSNEVWGAARLRDAAQWDRLAAAGIRPVRLDMARDDFSALPDDFTYVFHAAVNTGGFDDWLATLEINAQHSGQLLYHCRAAKGFVYCSTGSVYKYQGHRPLKESDPPGVPQTGNYTFSKVAGEAVVTWIAKHFNVPLTIIRIVSTYGPEGGAINDRVDAILEARPIRLYPDSPNNFSPIYEDDYVQLGIRAMEAARVPPLVVNWAGSETVSIEEYCAYIGDLVGVEPRFEYTDSAHTPLCVDVTLMHEALGRTQVHWRDGMRRMIEATHPELALDGERDETT